MTDEEYARMLQREYDREFDISVTMEQQQQTQNTSGGKKGKKTSTINWLLKNSYHCKLENIEDKNEPIALASNAFNLWIGA